MQIRVYDQVSDKVFETLSRRQNADASLTVQNAVREILTSIKLQGRQAVEHYRSKFDAVSSKLLSLTAEEISSAARKSKAATREAIKLSIANVEKYHRSHVLPQEQVETSPGIKCWRKALPIASVGLYIPGGSAPLFSSLIMLGVPARIAGCSRLMLCTPPTDEAGLDPNIAFVAESLGISELYLIGGAQAIGLMAYGCEGIAAADKIFGPGNRYVTLAKQFVSADAVAIDIPAGPSEVLVIADDSANPEFIALDILSQCEHGPDSQAVLLSNSQELITQVNAKLELYCEKLPRKQILQQSLANSFAVLTSSMQQAIQLSDIYAPEHLILACSQAADLLELIKNAGSVFIGNFSAEAFGDYASGPNHTLPTGGLAKSFSGVTLESFMKYVSFQNVSESGARQIGQAVVQMAREEGLEAHALAAKIRIGEI